MGKFSSSPPSRRACRLQSVAYVSLYTVVR